MNEPTLKGPLDRWAEICVRWVAPIAVTITVAFVYWTPAMRDSYDLQLSAPLNASVGKLVPLRAYMFAPEAEQDATQPSKRIEVRTSSKLSDTIEQTWLQKISDFAGFSGTLRAPSEAGDYSLIAIAEHAGREITRIERTIHVSMRAPKMDSNERLLDRLQSFTPQPIQPTGNAPAPSQLELRVRGGACVPEQQCEVLVWVGSPAASIHIEHSSNTEVVRESEEERFGIVSATVIVHGLESEIDLLASRANTLIARRRIRLPVALGGLALHIDQTNGASKILAEGLEASRPLLVDAYRDGHWERTGFVPEAKKREPFEAPFATLEQGIWQLQVRSDPFSTANAGSRIVFVKTSDLRPLAEAAVARDPSDDFAKKILETPAYPEDTPEELKRGFIAASLERFVYPQPEFTSSRTQNEPRLRAEMRKRAILAALVIGSFAVLIVAVLLRRGLRANQQALELMSLAGDDSEPSDQEKWRTTFSVILISISAGIVFAGGAIVTLRLLAQ